MFATWPARQEIHPELPNWAMVALQLPLALACAGAPPPNATLSGDAAAPGSYDSTQPAAAPSSFLQTRLAAMTARTRSRDGGHRGSSSGQSLIEPHAPVRASIDLERDYDYTAEETLPCLGNNEGIENIFKVQIVCGPPNHRRFHGPTQPFAYCFVRLAARTGPRNKQYVVGSAAAADTLGNEPKQKYYCMTRRDAFGAAPAFSLSRLATSLEPSPGDMFEKGGSTPYGRDSGVVAFSTDLNPPKTLNIKALLYHDLAHELFKSVFAPWPAYQVRGVPSPVITRPTPGAGMATALLHMHGHADRPTDSQGMLELPTFYTWGKPCSASFAFAIYGHLAFDTAPEAVAWAHDAGLAPIFAERDYVILGTDAHPGMCASRTSKTRRATRVVPRDRQSELRLQVLRPSR